MRTALLSAVLLGLGSACSTPAPRIPFRDTAWHASVLGGPWTVNTFVKEADALGLELVLDEPGTSGWAFEVGARYAKGDGDGQRKVDEFDPNAADGTSPTLVVDSYREIDFYEFDFGVRQIYRQGSALQPYFGVGGALLQARSLERFTQPAIPQIPLVEQSFTDHERTEIRPGFYVRTGLMWSVLRDQVREETEFPIAVDVRGLLSVDYSYLEFSLAFGFGR